MIIGHRLSHSHDHRAAQKLGEKERERVSGREVEVKQIESLNARRKDPARRLDVGTRTLERCCSTDARMVTVTQAHNSPDLMSVAWLAREARGVESRINS